MEQEEYEKEEIDWSYIDFVDNQDVLSLIEGKPMGIIALLDEQCRFPKASHETLSTKLVQEHINHPRFSQPKRSQTEFTLKHYAGDVSHPDLCPTPFMPIHHTPSHIPSIGPGLPGNRKRAGNYNYL